MKKLNLKNYGIIVSIQKYSLETTKEMANEAVNAGAIALRTDKDIGIDSIPIIGLKKIDVINHQDEAYITPDIKSIESVAEWTNNIAIDFRRLNKNLDEINEYCEDNNINIIADIANIADYYNILEKGYNVKYITTALSVLYRLGTAFYFPDKEFIKTLLKEGCHNLIAEGKYQTRRDVQWAYEQGCKAVCIGDAISNIYKRTLFFSSVKPFYDNDKRGNKDKGN